MTRISIIAVSLISVSQIHNAEILDGKSIMVTSLRMHATLKLRSHRIWHSKTTHGDVRRRTSRCVALHANVCESIDKQFLKLWVWSRSRGLYIFGNSR